MNFLKTSILSGLATIIRIMAGLVTNKLIAMYIGPTGIALLGYFQNVLSVINTLGTGAINSGVTKYIAEYNGDIPKRNSYISASLIIISTFSVFFGVLVFLLSSQLSSLVFASVEYVVIFKLVGLTLTITSLNNIILSLINGLKKIKLLVTINIISSIASLIITSFLVINLELMGALISQVIVQVSYFIITLSLFLRNRGLEFFKFSLVRDREIYRNLIKFSIMAIVSIFTVPIVQILIRNHLIENLSIQEAGYWQAVWKISEMYLLVLTTALATYYLPRLSELRTKIEIRNEIFSGYKIIIPFVLISSIIIYLFRDLVILILYTPEFRDMRNLFLFQLTGDFLKMCSWTLSYLMVAKAMTKHFVITEIVFSFLFYILSILFVRNFGISGVTYAYAVNYAIYLIVMIFIFREVLWIKKKEEEF
jgi:PST family polysaccharide transporter